MKKQKLITRPDLAFTLMQRGYKAEVGLNPYKPKLAAWTFDLDDEGEEIVSNYYAQRKKGGEAK